MEPSPLPQASADAPLVTRTLAGDLSAFDTIVSEHQARVRAYLRARMRDPHGADDLAQEVFIVAYRRLREFDASRPLGPWLRGIALNLLRNHRRSKRSSMVFTDEIEVLLAPSEDATLELETDDAVEALRDCLKALSPEAHELVHKRYTQGLPVEEICRLTGAKHSATTMALHRIRQKLQDCIGRKVPGKRARP